jgi:hypothetical protein
MQTSTASSSTIRFAALSLGLFFLLLGLAGFVPGLATISEGVTAAPGFGYIFGVFPTNYFHNAIGILVGVWGIAASTSLSGAIVFNRIFAIVYALGAILGLLPFSNTLFGLTPLFGSNVLVNLIAAAIAFYYGFIKSADVAAVNPSNAQPSV